MANLLLIFCAVFASLAAEAGIYPIFNREGNQATLMLSGIGGGDSDTQRLFEILAVGQQDEQGKWTKKAAFVDKQGVKAFSVVCVFSKIVHGSGTCTVVLHAAAAMMIDLPNKTVTYDLTDSAEASRMAQTFVSMPSGEIFRSANGRFVIAAERDGSGAVVRFLLGYR
ncbi:MAG: hypothetical protein AB7K68_15900 [Bacteriovoracia bacterium]